MKSESSVMLITGAGSGIGQGLVQHFAANGHHVLVSDVDGDAAERTAAAVRADGHSAEALRLDVISERDLDALRSRCEVQPIDVLVNNAGRQYVKPLDEFPIDAWRAVCDSILFGSAMCTRAVLPQMKARNRGRIINIGSVHSLVASAYKSAYVAAKHGLIGLSRTVALEVADFDITINTVCPAYVDTPMVRNQIAQQAKAHGISEAQVVNEIMLRHVPRKRFIGLDELAAAVAFFIAPEARNITAQALSIDCGWTAQ